MTDLSALLHDDSGAVTVDWVVLTACAAAFGVMVLAQLSTGATDMAEDIGSTLHAVDVVELEALGATH